MKRPLIGITVDQRDDNPDAYQSSRFYSSAVEAAGGMPVMLPFRLAGELVGDLVDRLDGLLLSGGGDLNPAAYGEEWHPDVLRCDPSRECFEMALLAAAEQRRLPVLGICLGCQVINVYRRGSLHQFLPDLPREQAIEHRRVDRTKAWHTHTVQVRPDSLLAGLTGPGELEVNTSHKQAIARPGEGLRVAAVAPDGVIEAIEAVEDPSFPLLLGVQWHPERLFDRREHLALFQRLVEQAAEVKSGRVEPSGLHRANSNRQTSPDCQSPKSEAVPV